MKIGINILPLKTGHKLRGIGYYTNNLLNFLKKDPNMEILEFTKLSEVKNVELIHYPWFDFYFHTLPINKKFKTLVTIHDTIPLIFPLHHPAGIKGMINFQLQKLALRNINHIITDSNISRLDIIKYLGVSESKITSIPLAADDDFTPVLNDTKLLRVKRKYKLPDKFLLYVGDANWTKNLPFLIKGFSILRQNPKLSGLRLVLVGDVFLKNVENIDHPELNSLKTVNKLIRELNLNDQIIRSGNLKKEDLVNFYNLATIYIQPSFYEGFGLPVLEALACGTPVVCSNGGSLPEVGGKAVIYFEPDNLGKFIKICEEVVLNKSLQKKLSDLALQQAVNFSWKKVASQTKQVYSRVINNE